MKTPRRPRVLSGEEARLWGEIAKLITPLRGRAALAKTKPSAAADPPPVKPPAKAAKTSPSAIVPPPAPKRPVKLADLAPAGGTPVRVRPPFQPSTPVAPGLERKERRALQRGTLGIEARIDLHGLYQAEAHVALIGFIARSRAAGHARVLVVTGKGGAQDRELFSERGVLRRSVPHWLRGPELRGLVLGFEEAARHHGGAGALYVRLKRR